MTTPRTYVLLAGFLFTGLIEAQMRVDKPIVLNGATTTDRQVTGLHDATATDDALNARILQQGLYHYAAITGTSAWQAAPQPVITQINSGLCLLLHSANTNSGPVTLSVNGSAPWPVVKNGSSPLDSADVAAGAEVSVVFDGATFQLISARKLERKPCPSGTVQVNALYCIEIDQHDTVDFPTASDTCGAIGMRLCTWGEWYVACTQATQLGLNNMTGDWEWSNSSANGDGIVRVMGQSNCSQAATTPGWNSIARNYRCCYRR